MRSAPQHAQRISFPVRLILVPLILILLAACSPRVVHLQESQIFDLSTRQAVLETALAVEQAQSAAVATAAALSREETAVLETRVSTLTAENSLLISENANQELQALKATQALEETTAQLDQLRQSTRCGNGNSLVFDLADHTAVSRSLRTFITDYEGSPPAASWEQLPGHPGTAIHSVSGRETWVFVVSLAEQDAGRGTSVFWVDLQCFLDLP